MLKLKIRFCNLGKYGLLLPSSLYAVNACADNEQNIVINEDNGILAIQSVDNGLKQCQTMKLEKEFIFH